MRTPQYIRQTNCLKHVSWKLWQDERLLHWSQYKVTLCSELKFKITKLQPSCQSTFLDFINVGYTLCSVSVLYCALGESLSDEFLASSCPLVPLVLNRIYYVNHKFNLNHLQLQTNKWTEVKYNQSEKSILSRTSDVNINNFNTVRHITINCFLFLDSVVFCR